MEKALLLGPQTLLGASGAVADDDHVDSADSDNSDVPSFRDDVPGRRDARRCVHCALVFSTSSTCRVPIDDGVWPLPSRRRERGHRRRRDRHGARPQTNPRVDDPAPGVRRDVQSRPETGQTVLLPGKSRRGGGRGRQRGGSRTGRRHLLAVQGTRRAVVARRVLRGARTPVLWIARRLGQRPTDAGPLRRPGPQLSHGVVAVGHAAPARRRLCLCQNIHTDASTIDASTIDRRPAIDRGVLFRRRHGERGRLSRGAQLCLDPSLPGRLHLSEQRLCYIDSDHRAVRWRWHRLARRGVRHGVLPGRRRRRARRGSRPSRPAGRSCSS